MIVVNAFVKKSVNRNGCTAWQLPTLHCTVIGLTREPREPI